MPYTNLDRIMPGKCIIRAHESRGHGTVLTLNFTDGEEMCIWVFEGKQQTVIWNPGTNKITYDGRTEDCKGYTERALARLNSTGNDCPFGTFDSKIGEY